MTFLRAVTTRSRSLWLSQLWDKGKSNDVPFGYYISVSITESSSVYLHLNFIVCLPDFRYFSALVVWEAQKAEDRLLSLTLQTAKFWTGPATHCSVSSEISVKREHGVLIPVMRDFYFLIHDFHNGGQLGKNGNYNIRARPVRPQQNKHGRVSNVGRVASRRKWYSWRFTLRPKTLWIEKRRAKVLVEV